MAVSRGRHRSPAERAHNCGRVPAILPGFRWHESPGVITAPSESPQAMICLEPLIPPAVDQLDESSRLDLHALGHSPALTRITRAREGVALVEQGADDLGAGTNLRKVPFPA